MTLLFFRPIVFRFRVFRVFRGSCPTCPCRLRFFVRSACFVVCLPSCLFRHLPCLRRGFVSMPFCSELSPFSFDREQGTGASTSCSGMLPPTSVRTLPPREVMPPRSEARAIRPMAHTTCDVQPITPHWCADAALGPRSLAHACIHCASRIDETVCERLIATPHRCADAPDAELPSFYSQVSGGWNGFLTPSCPPDWTCVLLFMGLCALGCGGLSLMAAHAQWSMPNMAKPSRPSGVRNRDRPAAGPIGGQCSDFAEKY